MLDKFKDYNKKPSVHLYKKNVTRYLLEKKVFHTKAVEKD